MFSGEKPRLARSEKGEKLLFAGGCLLYALAVSGLYYQYVPRVRGLQTILIPLLLLTVVSTVFSIRAGTLVIVFLIPLVNSLPYFFGYSGFNPLLFIFCGYFLGVLIHRALRPRALGLKYPLLLPVLGASLVLIVSVLITFWRYTNFFPLHMSSIFDLAVNVLNVSAGEGLRRVLFDGLNYLGGFIWFFILVNVMRTKKVITLAMSLFAAASLISFAFGMYQDLSNSGLGNHAPFAEVFRINGLFTDPNALGVFLALSLPLLAGTLLAEQGLKKALYGLTLLAGILIIPDAGSRVGMLGVALGFGFFLMLLIKIGIQARKKNPEVWKAAISHAAVAVILAVLISSFVLVKQRSALHHRLGENIRALKVIFDPRAQEIILHGRHLTWPAAMHMIREFPLSGIGVGAFTSELPNYFKKYDVVPIKSSFYYRDVQPEDFHVDTAGNYYLHVASEMGLIGLFFFGWIFFPVLKRIYRANFKVKAYSEWSFLEIGLSASVLVMLIMFLLGAHTVHFEIQLSFWLLVGLLYATPPPVSPLKEESLASPDLAGSRVLLKVSMGVLIVVFAALHSWNSFHRLSLQARTERFHLIQEFGLYQKEVMNGQPFRWTKSAAGMTVKMNKPVLVVPILASHPDIRQNPVTVKVYLAEDLWQRKTEVEEFELKESSWKERRYEFGDRLGMEFMLYFEVSRTWRPRDASGSPDRRHLGIAIGQLRFEHTAADSSDTEHLSRPAIKTPVDPETKKPDKLKVEKQVTQEETRFGEGRRTLQRFEPLGGEGEMGGKPPNVTEWNLEVRLPKGDFLFILRAKGQEAGKELPLAGIWIDDRLSGEDWVAPDIWEDYCYQLRLKAGIHRIRVAFLNEAYVAQTREYRKLFIERLDIVRMQRTDGGDVPND